MAVLTVEFRNRIHGAVLPPRILIGRRSMNHLIIDDPGVSRMHAWIEGEGDRFYIHDAGSRTGTRVNGQRIVARHLLGDEDVISIGPAKLLFLAEPRVRPGIESIDLSVEPSIAAEDAGILFDCPSCAAPLWAGAGFAGGSGQCKYCGNDVIVPHSKPARSTADPKLLRTFGGRQPRKPRMPASPVQRSRPAPAMKRSHGKCGVCQSIISDFEERTTCPTCGLLFHSECWIENYGCSAYGCPRVDSLKPKELHPGHSPLEADGAMAALSAGAGSGSAVDGKPARVPWEFLLLAGSVFSALLGAVCFGLPSLALAGGAVTYIAKTRGQREPNHRGVLLLSAALALLGVFTGVTVSYFLYFGGPRIH